MRACAVLVSLAVAACWPAPPELAGGARAPLAAMSGHLLVRADLDGRPLTFIVDTAATITAVTRRTAARLGLIAIGRTPVNGRMSAIGVVRRLAVAGTDHHDVRVAVIDHDDLERRRARVDGVLGLDVLARHDLVIDLRRRTLALHPRATIARAAAGMQRVPFERATNGLIIVRVAMGDQRALPAIVDLGSPVTYLNTAAAASMGKSGVLLRRQRLDIGDVEVGLKTVIVEDRPVFAKLGLARQPAILLGTDAFAHRTLAIAYADRAAFVSR